MTDSNDTVDPMAAARQLLGAVPDAPAEATPEPVETEAEAGLSLIHI